MAMNLFGQTYNMSNTTINTCSGTFYDSGGSGGNYADNQNLTMTFCSSIPGANIVIDFTSFDVESGWDFLSIYDGANTGSPLIGTYSGTAPPGIFTSSNGCLTFLFTSDIIFSQLQDDASSSGTDMSICRSEALFSSYKVSIDTL